MNILLMRSGSWRLARTAVNEAHQQAVELGQLFPFAKGSHIFEVLIIIHLNSFLTNANTMKSSLYLFICGRAIHQKPEKCQLRHPVTVA